MKILFICSCLQPGKDGVGDYTRRLAGELIRQGYDTTIIALNEKHLDVEIVSNQIDQNSSINVIRFPDSLSWNYRITKTISFIEEFSPDWISLQYVGFGYHKLGLPFELLKNLDRIRRGRRFHIMFHELWCGMAKTAGIKEKLLGRMQKAFIHVMIWASKPDMVFTNVQPYQRRLKRFYSKTRLAPIFGNIPVDEWGDERLWFEMVKEKSLQHFIDKKSEYLIIGFFGSIYPCVGLDLLMEQLSDAAKSLHVTLSVLVIGRGRGLDIQSLVKNVEEISVITTGMLEPEMVNRAMNLADAGIITTPADGLDKSGAAVAWMERGKPIFLSNSDGSYIKEICEPLGVFQIASALDIIKALKNSMDIKKVDRLKHVADLYLNCFAGKKAIITQ